MRRVEIAPLQWQENASDFQSSAFWRQTEPLPEDSYSTRMRTTLHPLFANHYASKWFAIMDLMLLIDCKGVAAPPCVGHDSGATPRDSQTSGRFRWYSRSWVDQARPRVQGGQHKECGAVLPEYGRRVLRE